MLTLVSLLFVSLPVGGCTQGRFYNDLRAEHEEFPHSAEQRRFSEALQGPRQDSHDGNRYGSIGPYYGELYRLGGYSGFPY